MYGRESENEQYTIEGGALLRHSSRSGLRSRYENLNRRRSRYSVCVKERNNSSFRNHKTIVSSFV